MKFRERRAVENPRLMIIPMIDIIFFLLVFFMMSTMFMVEQKVLPVTLPSASTAELDMHRTFPVTVMALSAPSLEMVSARASSLGFQCATCASPLGSRRIRPPSTSGVFLDRPASCMAAWLAQPACPSMRRSQTG